MSCQLNVLSFNQIIALPNNGGTGGSAPLEETTAMSPIFATSRIWRPITLSSAVLLLGTLLTIGPAAADPHKA